MSDLLEEVAGLERALSLLSTSLTPVQYMMLRAVLRAELEGGGILAWGMGLGKCLGLDVPVLTADGSTKLAKDVSIGDLLVGDDGSVRVVLSTVRGKSPMYRVGPTGARAANALESGFTCNDSHQLVFEVGQNSFDKPRLDLPRDAYEVRYLTQKDPQALPTRGSVRLRWGDVPPNKAHAHEAARQLASIHINDYRISQVFSAFKVTRKMDRSLVRAFPYGNDAVRYLPTQADALAAATVGIYESHRSATLRTCTLSASDLYRMASAARANRGTPVENGAVINVDELFPGRLNGFRRPVLHFPQEFNLQHLLNIFFDTQMPEILPRHRLMAERCAWYLGAWLGDGSENRIDTICQSEELFPEMVETFHEIAGSAGLDVECSTQEQNRSAPLYRLIRQDGNRDTNVLWYVARHIGMVQMGGTGSNGHVYGPGEERGHKYIPACLIASSRSVRLHLLAGLIDTDGYYGGDSNGHYEITQKREMLARGIVFLARSLGLKASIHEKWVDYTYNGTTTKGLYFRVVISGMAGSEIPVTIRKKLCQNDGTKRQKNPLHYGVEVERIAEQGEYAGFQIGMLASDHMLPALIDALRLQQATEQKQALLYSMIHDRQLIPSNANGTAVGDRYPGRFLLGDFTVTHNTLVMLLQSVIDHVLWSSKGATARQTLIIGAPALHAVWHQQLRDHVQPGVLTMSQYTDSKQPEAGLSGNIVFCTYTRVLLDAKEHLGTAAPILCNTPVQSLRTREPMCQLKQATDHSMRMIRSPLAKRGLFSKQWHRIVVDEADALRNLKSMRFRYLLGLPATVRWWVTGTPLNNSFADIVSAMLFLREKQVCLELPLQLDPMGLLRGIKNEQEKRSRQSFERRAHVLTAQMVVEDYPHLLEQDPRLQYLSAPVYMFQYAQPFRTEEERQVYKRMQDDLVSVLKELRQCVEQLQLQRQQQASAANAAAAEELGEIQNEHVLAHENEEDMEKEQQQIQDQILHQRPKQQGGGVGGLVQQAVQNVRQSQNPQWAARATVNFFYLRCMQAALLPSFADKPLQDSPNLHYHVQSSTMQDLVMWLRERVPAQDKVVVYCMWTTVLRMACVALQQAGITAVEFYGGMTSDEHAQALRRMEQPNDQAGSSRVLLAQTRVGGVGQTFTFANWVFFLGPWFNPQLERQALSRIHRMGQRKTCHVVWLLRCSTIHEIIRGNASNKMRHSEELLMSVDRQYPKVSEMYAQLTLLITGEFQPRDGYLDYQKREEHRKVYLERSHELLLQPYRSYRLAGLVPQRASLWRVEGSDAMLLEWTRLCAVLNARVLADPHPVTMAPPPNMQWLYTEGPALERDRQLTGDYNEGSLISNQVLPIGRAASATLNGSVRLQLPLHLSTALAFLSCQACRMLADARNRSYAQIHQVSEAEDSWMPMLQLAVPAVPPAGQVEIQLRDHSKQSYLEYTRTLIAAAMRSKSSALCTRAMMTYYWASGYSPVAERRVLAAWMLLPDGHERLLSITSGVMLLDGEKRVAMFALGTASDETLSEDLRRQVEQRLRQEFVQREFLCLEPSELQQQLYMPLVQTRKGIQQRPVLHLRCVDQPMVLLLSQQQNLVLKHQVHEIHQALTSSADPCSSMAHEDGRHFSCTLIWETFDEPGDMPSATPRLKRVVTEL